MTQLLLPLLTLLALAALLLSGLPQVTASHEARAVRCRASKDCSRTAYCSFGRCRRKKYDGAVCSSYASCFSGSCDRRTGKCATTNLSLGTRCSASMKCKSGNCQNSVCARKKANGSYCYKNSNCISSACDTARKVCIPVAAGEQPVLQPSIPWNKDLTDLSNIDPSPGIELYYLDSGAIDPAVSQLFATVKADLTTPAVVLSHSVFIGSPKCESAATSSTGGAGLEIPFASKRAYDRAKSTWLKIADKPFIIVTATDGCGPADKADERTFWLSDPNGLVFNDAAQSVDVRCHEVAHEDVINQIDLNFGTSNGTGGSNGNTGGTGGGGSGSNPSNTTDPNVGSGSGGSDGCATLTGNTFDSLPAVACGPNFDERLDSLAGFYNLYDATTFSEGAKSLAPGLGDHVFEDYVDESEKFNQGTAYSDTLRRRNLHKRGLLSFIKKGASVVGKAISAPVKAVVSTALSAVASTPLGPVIDRVLEAASPKIDHKLPLNLKPTKGLKMSKNFGEQFEIFSTEVKKKNGFEGSLGLYCVDCGITGSAHLQGQLLFTIQNGGELKEGYLMVNGGLKAAANLGLEADASYNYTAKKNIVTVPIGGFALKDLVVVGPSLGLDAQFKFSVAAAGSVLVGAEYGFEAFEARLDLKSEQAWTQKGFEPKFNKRFEAAGTIEAEATLSLPVTIGFGVVIKPLGFDKKVAISAEPGVGANAKYTFNNTAVVGEIECNNGVQYEVGIQSEVMLNFLGDRKPLGEPYKKVLAQDCLRLGADPGQPKPTEGDSNNGTDTSGGGSGDANTGGSDSSGSGPTPPGDSGPSTGDTSTAPSGRRRTLLPRQSTSTNTGSLGDGDFTADDLNFADDELTSEGDAALDSAITQSEANAEQSTLTVDGVSFVQIRDTRGRFYISSNSDGTISVVTDATDGGTYFELSDNVVLSDDSNSPMVYYPATMNKYGVSRLRIVDYGAVPKTADLLYLLPVNEDNTSSDGIYVAVTTDNQTFFPVICNYADGRAARVFLAKDPVEGANKLKDVALRNTITGGAVSQCQFLALASQGFAGF